MPQTSRVQRWTLVGATAAGCGVLAAAVVGAGPASAEPSRTTAASAPSAAPGTPTSAPVATVPSPDQPAGQVLLGVVGGTVPVKNATRLTAFQALAGRQMATVREYANWDTTTFPDPLATTAASRGQIVFLSLKTKTSSGSPVTWASIASGAQDATAHRWAATVKSFGAPVMFTLNHEPEVSKSDAYGTAADYVAAWRHLVSVFRADGVTNAEYVFIGTAYGWKRTDARSTPKFYPGDDWVDDIAADGYNWFTCRPAAQLAWTSPSELFGPFLAFGRQHPAKGLVIPEFGTVEDPAVPGRKAQWFSDLENMLTQPGTGQFRAVAEWYSFTAPGACNWQIDTSSSATAAFQSWGRDPQYTSTALAPSTVRQVVATVTAAAPSTATLTWAPAGPGGARVSSYTVTVTGPSGAESFAVDGATTSMAYTPSVPPATATTYRFTVSATNAAGTDRPSTPASATLSGVVGR